MNINCASKLAWESLSRFSPRGEELLSSCFVVMIHCLEARRCYVMLSDKERSELAVVKASGPRGTFTAGDRVAWEQSIASWVAEHKQPLLSTNHNTRGTGPAEWKEEGDYGPFLAVPILGEEDLRGVLMACEKLHGGVFSEHDLVTAEMLANHLALCIEGGFLFWGNGEEPDTALPPPTKKPS